MAATGTKQQQPTATPVATVVDPKFEWTERAGTYVLRLTLTGFRKDDFRVQVDGAGRLTIRGTRPGASLHKVFQLPSSASLDDIAGRFEAGVLTLTVRKLASSGAGVAKDKEDGAPPTSVAPHSTETATHRGRGVHGPPTRTPHPAPERPPP